MKCIYCLGDEKSKHFCSQEHVFPRTIGGKRKLSKGLVCDECNNSFSVIERRFTHDSYISLFKLTEGPRGRHGNYKTNLFPIKSNDGDIDIGYVEANSNQHLVNQFVIEEGDIVSFSGEEMVDNYEELYNETLRNIRSKKIDDMITIKNDNIPSNQIHISYSNGKIFCFCNKDIKDDKKIYLASLLFTGNLNIELNSLQNITKKQMEGTLTLNISLNDFHRVIGKMFFNYFAYCYQNEVYDEKYNILRNYIKGNDNKYKNIVLPDTSITKYISKLKSKFQIENESHIIIIADMPQKDDLLGFVSLYGVSNFRIILGNEKKAFHDERFRMFINEYKIQKEYDLFDKITKNGDNA
jgi:hypothetical protein